jgi:UPF0716 protein FxsA
MPWIFLLLPWIELWTLIELGSATSALTALAWVFLTLMLGLGLVRRQGLRLVAEMQRQGGLFGPQMLMDDLSVVSCGLLLMVPGLVTDFLGVVLLIGPLRRRLLGSRRRDGGEPGAPGRPGEQVTLEGEFRRLDD